MRKFGAAFRIVVIAVLTSLVALTTVVFGPTSIAQPTAGGLSLAKSASPQVGLQSGDKVTYTFLVTNSGATPISDVGVDEIRFTGSGSAPDANCSSSTTLQPGQSVTCTATYEVTDDDAAACFVDNTAKATGTDSQGTPNQSAPSSARVLTDCGNNFAGSATLPPLLGSSGLGLSGLGSLAAGSVLGVGSLGLGTLGALGALGAWALSTPYQPPPAAQCQNAPFPIVPYLIAPCPNEQSPHEQSPETP